MPMTMRPSETSWSVAKALAVTVGSRVPGFVTLSPSLQRSVFIAASVSSGYGSCQSTCESYVQPYSKPLLLGELHQLDEPLPGGSGRTVTPKLNMRNAESTSRACRQRARRSPA